VPREFVSDAARVITRARSDGPGSGLEETPAIEATPQGWPRARASLVRAILASATPERTDRLFPGDPRQFDSGGGLGMAYGSAGATGDASYLDTAQAVAASIAERLGGEDAVGDISGGEHPFAGLMRGSAGVALFFMRLYETTGNPVLLDLAAMALRQDLRRTI